MYHRENTVQHGNAHAGEIKVFRACVVIMTLWLGWGPVLRQPPTLCLLLLPLQGHECRTPCVVLHLVMPSVTKGRQAE
jgi:hypothetical protein